MASSSQPPICTASDIPSLAAAYNLTKTEVGNLSSLSSAAKATAYCPYSRFRVGATLLTTDGQYFSGANVENASYPVGTCAERVALGKAVTDLAAQVDGGRFGQGGTAGDGRGGFGEWKRLGGGFRALAVSTDVISKATEVLDLMVGMEIIEGEPIREFCELDMPIWLFDKDGSFQVLRLEQLLPLSFGPEHLPPPV